MSHVELHEIPAELETGPQVPFENSTEQLLAGLAYVHWRVRWAVARARANGLDPHDEFLGLYISDEQVDRMLALNPGQHLWQHLPRQHQHPERANGHDWQIALDTTRRQWRRRTALTRQAGIPMRLEGLSQAFALDDVELDALLIVLAPEIDPRYERIYAYLQDDVTRKRPSVNLVLGLLTDDFARKLQWRGLLAEGGRLLRHGLLTHAENGGDRGHTLLSQPLRPAAAVVEHLLGNTIVDRKLAGCATLKQPPKDDFSPERLPQRLASRLTAAASVPTSSVTGPAPIFALRGGYGLGKDEAAQLIAHTLRRPLLTLHVGKVEEQGPGLVPGLRLALRDGRLSQAVLYLPGWDTTLADGRSHAEVLQLLLAYPGVVIVSGQKKWQASTPRARPVLPVVLAPPDYEARLQIWQRQLQSELPRLDSVVHQVANQFRFTPGQIEDVVATAHDFAQWRGQELAAEHVLEACRAHSNQKLSSLATKIRPRYRWQDIVLPPDTLAQLREMVATVRQQPTVYGDWGFGHRMALGKGLNALFAGESGTGKTMAADIMAGVLGQDLYKIDLSLLVSKYIGETEKNLNRIFREAATSNAILFFDEADAIFGKRSEVKDSHDRYANIEISYLLQRMETYDGVVILATNLRANLDEAFTRRLQFVVEFPFPQAPDRQRIWQVNVPPQMPLGDDVDFELLAQRFRLAGGNIRNIILAAAFLAAEADEPVSMAHLLHAARREFQKMGRLIDEKKFIVAGDASQPS